MSIADRIRDGIKLGRYHPRERLVEAELAEEYGVARSAIRKALLELAAEGLIERRPNRGARVRSFSSDEAIEITETRLSLQAMCASKAAAAGTDEDRSVLLQNITDLRSAVARNSQDEYVDLNRRIFDRIRDMSGHVTAMRIIEQLQNQSSRQALEVMLPERRFESLREFERIVAAVVSHDSSEAYRATLEHMDNVLAALHAVSEGRSVAGAVSD